MKFYTKLIAGLAVFAISASNVFSAKLTSATSLNHQDQEKITQLMGETATDAKKKELITYVTQVEEKAQSGAYERGFETGIGKGLDTAYGIAEHSFDKGYEQGHDHGHEAGHKTGFHHGAAHGFDHGKALGKAEGYEVGHEHAKNHVHLADHPKIAHEFLTSHIKEKSEKSHPEHHQ